ncbi:hypothetical protein ACIPY6_28890 [Streptomyces sp. NPDC090054]
MIRSADVINAEIRALWVQGVLLAEDRDRYLRLIVEWAESEKVEQQLAA